jgi:hypothetical protein
MRIKLRVVAPGGWVTPYDWDILDGGFPLVAVQAELSAMGQILHMPPSVGVSRLAAMTGLWRRQGLVEMATREITEERAFVDFDDYWRFAMLGTSIGPSVAAMPAADQERLKSGVRPRLPAAGDDCIVVRARTNAIKGRVGYSTITPDVP